VAGRCAQTLVGRAQVLLHERDDATRLFVRPSFAGYLTDLLLEVRRVANDLRA
jgi:sarcosine oxidase gamma subunit